MGSIQQTFDFIVVGSGPAGCMAAARLANTKARPSVLLIEGGGKNDESSARIDAQRWLTKSLPDFNWGYQTLPMKSADNRVIAYDRGKGLGGSSAINFSVWTVAPSEDHDQLAQIVGDDEWSWKKAHERYKRLESYYAQEPFVPEGVKKYLDVKPEDHGDSGPIKIGFPLVWENGFYTPFDRWHNAGYKINLDHNNGDPIGIAACASTAFQGVRVTAADAISDAPQNLHVLINAPVTRVIFDGQKAVGVAILDGTTYKASHEVIISAGSIDSARILMHSGIGPKDQLESFDIPVISNVPGVGQNLQDHYHVPLSFARSADPEGHRAFWRSKELQLEARKQWEQTKSGPLAEMDCMLGIGFLKLDSIYQTEEFKSLPEKTQQHMRKPTIPLWEVIINCVNYQYLTDPDNAPVCDASMIFVMNPQSRGSCTLQSADPTVQLTIDSNFFSHPYDRRLAVEMTRETFKHSDIEPSAREEGKYYLQPKSMSEEHILEYWRANLASTWHATGTCRMGSDLNDPQTCVDSGFRVKGVQNLRVADMSIIPVITNNHTQATAYLIGLTAGDKLVEEYGLDA